MKDIMDSSDNTESPVSDTEPAPPPNPDKQTTSRVSTLSGISTISTRSSLTSAPDSQIDDAEDDSNVNVVVRVRPLNSQETGRSDAESIEFPADNSVLVDHQGRSKSFTFNAVFQPSATQQDVFENCGIKRLIEMALGGYAGTIFAYGQTGSGKTHTITGPLSRDEPPNPEVFGLIQRSFQYLFEKIKQNTDENGISYTLSASYLEIYNEQVKDLLNPSERSNLGVRWSKTKGFYVENLFVVECESTDDLMAVLEEGISHRQTGSNNINEHSSRSHSMLSLFIDSEVPDPDDDALYITKQGKLSFVDLAGSEKIKELGNNGGELLTETTNINKSLLTLGNCISSLSDPKKKAGYIPYRDSKLTKLLADSLGGSGVTLMIACVSPSSYSVPESMNTLRYANRAKRIKNKPVVRMDPREKLLMSLKREVKLLRSENEYLKGHLKKPSGGESKQKEGKADESSLKHATTNGHIPNANNSDSDGPVQKPKPKLERKARENSTSSISTSLSMKSAADNGLYEMLQEYMIENENLRSENNELSSTRQRARREHEYLSKENEKLGKKLEDLERVMASSPLSFARYSFYSRGSSGRSSQPLALASVTSSWRAESNTPVSQQQYQQQDAPLQPLPQQGFTQPQPQQYAPPQQPTSSQHQPLPQQHPHQYQPNSYAPAAGPVATQQQPPYQPFPQQQPPPPPPPQQQQQQQQPFPQQRISPNNPIPAGHTKNGPSRQPPPKKQLHELPPVDNMKGVPNTYKVSKQAPYQLQQKNSKNKILDNSQKSQDPHGSYVDRFQQQQTFNKLYGPEQATTSPRQSKQANINIPPARGLERRDESPDKSIDHSKSSPQHPSHHQGSPKQQQAANARSSEKTHAKHGEKKAKGARGEKGVDPSLDAIPPTPTATPPPVKYTPKGTHQMLQSSSIDMAKTSASSGNWNQINDKLRQELQELDGEIEYMKYMNKSQASSAAPPKPAPRTRKR